MTIANLKQVGRHKNVADVFLQSENSDSAVQTLANALSHPDPTTQLLLTSKIRMHKPEAGLNPLVDAAATVFSTMGRLKHVKSCWNLAELREELIQEIDYYREAVQMYHQGEQYLAEYIPITCYALCATLDDVISSTPWGGQGKWNDYSLVMAFNQERLSQKSFFIILERLVRDPDIYIDVMEFMYICLSLGFKCHFNTNSAEFDYEQLEQITNSLYKRIRSHRGNFSKVLSPYPIRPVSKVTEQMWIDHVPSWAWGAIACALIMAVMAGGRWLLQHNYEQTSQQLVQPVAGAR